MSSTANHYQILGVDIEADEAAIKKAYKSLALTNHPDKTSHLSEALVEERTRIFKLATTAYEILLDPVKRANYDETLAQKVRPLHTTTAHHQYQRPSTPSKQHPSKRSEPFQSPKFFQYRTPPRGTSAQQSPGKHPFTTSTVLGPIGAKGSLHFFAPVLETPTRTILDFSNQAGWDFQIQVSRKYKWIRRPVLPSLHADTKDEITIKITMQRKAYYAAVATLTDVVLDVRDTPKKKNTVFSSILRENRQDMELCIIIKVLPVTPTTPPPPTPAWSWSFNVDLGFMMLDYKELRATHLIFYPRPPLHALGEDEAVPEKEPFPLESPQAELARLFEGIQFVVMAKGFYCQEVKWAGRTRWRLAAVGSI